MAGKFTGVGNARLSRKDKNFRNICGMRILISQTDYYSADRQPFLLTTQCVDQGSLSNTENNDNSLSMLRKSHSSKKVKRSEPDITAVSRDRFPNRRRTPFARRKRFGKSDTFSFSMNPLDKRKRSRSVEKRLDDKKAYMSRVKELENKEPNRSPKKSNGFDKQAKFRMEEDIHTQASLSRKKISKRHKKSLARVIQFEDEDQSVSGINEPDNDRLFLPRIIQPDDGKQFHPKRLGLGESSPIRTRSLNDLSQYWSHTKRTDRESPSVTRTNKLDELHAPVAARMKKLKAETTSLPRFSPLGDIKTARSHSKDGLYIFKYQYDAGKTKTRIKLKQLSLIYGGRDSTAVENSQLKSKRDKSYIGKKSHRQD